MAGIKIHASVGNGMTLQKFGEILAQRMQYLHETARDSITACALQVLRSIRTVTMVAKPNKLKPKLQRDNSVYPSFTTVGKQRRTCLRIKGSKERWTGTAKVVFA